MGTRTVRTTLMAPARRVPVFWAILAGIGLGLIALLVMRLSGG